ncbi:hypothetical protein [Aquimarina rubra]|uniref:DUF2306 domain-containing protein n=1 Tax=Aquimarina rubra TaxID=1920033 RepID=A0ABW5LA67_9FLAO
METMTNNILYVHILAGSLALISGFIAMISPKGKTWHRKSGKLYFYAMTGVFITGIIVAGLRFNRFLFLIAFLSYYSVFCGVRILKLKKLHQQQKGTWYDWFAGIVNAIANIVFIILGLYYGIARGFTSGGALLSIGFGIGGLLISYANLSPLIKKPEQAYHWYLSHIGNMMGGYIATVTAFISTMVTRYDLMNPYLAFALPSLIGIPILLYWQKRIEKKFETAKIK